MILNNTFHFLLLFISILSESLLFSTTLYFVTKILYIVATILKNIVIRTPIAYKNVKSSPKMSKSTIKVYKTPRYAIRPTVAGLAY